MTVAVPSEGKGMSGVGRLPAGVWPAATLRRRSSACQQGIRCAAMGRNGPALFPSHARHGCHVDALLGSTAIPHHFASTPRGGATGRPGAPRTRGGCLDAPRAGLRHNLRGSDRLRRQHCANTATPFLRQVQVILCRGRLSSW